MPTPLGARTASPSTSGDTAPGTRSRASATAPTPFCILVWRFRCPASQLERLTGILDSSSAAGEEPKCLFRRTSRRGRELQLRVGLEDSFGVLTHVVSFSSTLEAALELGELEGIEIYGHGAELARLSGPLAAFAPVFYEQDFSTAV